MIPGNIVNDPRDRAGDKDPVHADDCASSSHGYADENVPLPPADYEHGYGVRHHDGDDAHESAVCGHGGAGDRRSQQSRLRQS